ncbi:MAG: rhodanese-like domain-containing protein [Holophagaceae bacterium]
MLRYLIYIIPLVAIGYLLWSRRSASATDLQALFDRKPQVVDVRTKAEFRGARHVRAVNIPLNELSDRLKELDRARPVVVCCESGSRSGMAVGILKKAGFPEVANLGSWRRLQTFLP